MASVTNVFSSGEDFDGILHNFRWNATTLTYSFPTSSSLYAQNYGFDEPDHNFQALNSQQISAVRALLGQIEGFTKLKFLEVPETNATGSEGELRFAMSDRPSTAWGYYPANAEEGGDSWYNNESANYDSPILGSYAYNEGFMHEIGHTLGLRHGHEGSSNPFGGLPSQFNSNEYSVMTYADYIGDPATSPSNNETWGNPQSYMMLDIAALQYLYGADYTPFGNVWSGDSVYTFSTTTGEMFINGVGQGTPGGNRIFRTIWDGDGTDTYDLSNYSTDLKIDLAPGRWSTFDVNQLADLDGGSRTTNLAAGNVANALLHNGDIRSLIDNAIGGSGDDDIRGNLGANILEGRDGNDQIFGEAGKDRIFGGDGDDFIDAGRHDDVVYSGKGADVVYLGSGNDYVRVGGGQEEFHGGSGKDYISYYDSTGGVTVNLATNTVSGSWASNDIISGFESVSGSKVGNDTIYGTSSANTIKTYGGNDKVYAGKGADVVYLGSGNDYVRVGGGQEEFYGGSGKDYISYYDSTGGVTVNLATNTVSGSWASNDIISGFESVSGSKTGNDTIYGTSGSNTIKTYGGNDKVYAGKGADVVYLGSGNDYVLVGGGQESFNGGTGKDYISYYNSTGGITIDLEADSVFGSWAVNDTISDFEGASGSKTGADKMYGTSGSNTLKSYGGNDRLYGRSGDDKLYGGDGQDFFDGGAGTDLLYGGAGSDIFQLDRGEDHDIIKDFEDNIDTIELDNFAFATASEALNSASQVGSDVVFDFGNGDMLTVEDATIAMLQDDLEIV